MLAKIILQRHQSKRGRDYVAVQCGYHGPVIYAHTSAQPQSRNASQADKKYGESDNCPRLTEQITLAGVVVLDSATVLLELLQS